MKQSTILFFAIILLCTATRTKIFAQNMSTLKSLSDSVQTAWVKHYMLVDSSVTPVDLAVDRSGNVYVTGYISPRGDLITFRDCVTIKYNSDGVEQWIALYNGPANTEDEPSALAVDRSGNVYITGYTFSYSTRTDYATVKYDSNGTELWSTIYNGPNNSADQARDITVDDSGNVYVTGISWDSPGSDDYVTIKYNTYGIEQWTALYNGPADDEDQATAIEIDDSGNVYVTGYSIGIGTGWDFATIKYNANGEEQWVIRDVRGGGSTLIAVDDSGHVYVAGAGNGYVVFKYNSNGIEQWFARYTDADYTRALAVDDSGNVYVTGESWGSGTRRDYATVKYNSDGIEQWVARYNGPPGNHNDLATDLAVDGSGNVYVTGMSGGIGTYYDYATVKYNSDGIEQWIARYNGIKNLDDGAIALAIDDSANVYVTGYSYIGYYHSVITTIKYTQKTLVLVIQKKIGKPDNYWLHQNYPNPFNSETMIRYELKKPSLVNLTLYDLMGKEVRTLIDEKQIGGSYQVIWNGRDNFRKEVSSGVYFCQLRVGSLSQTRKMCLIR